MTFEACLSKYLQLETNENPPTSATVSPIHTTGDCWKPFSGDEERHWSDGYLPGIHWIASDVDLIDSDRAIEVTRTIESAEGAHTRIGFRHQYSWIPAYEATGKSKFKRRALKAAERLSRCYYPDLSLLGNPVVNDGTVQVNIRSIMNVPLLFWAMNHSPNGDQYRNYLEGYLKRITQLFVKSNGSVRNRITYNLESREIDRVSSPRGIPGGCWTRGLAWTVYGLTLGGIYLNNEEFLDTAKTAMDYHVENTYDLIPAFDYSVSALKKPNLTDTSTAAILASAMLLLGRLRENSRAETLGRRITNRLFDNYLREPDQAGLIDGACFHYPENRGVNEATIWGDFYALEAFYLKENNELPSHLNWIGTTPHSRRKAS